MDRPVSTHVSVRSLRVSKRAALSLVLSLAAIALSLLVAPSAARADGRPHETPTAANPASIRAFTPAAGDVEIVVGCLSDADCPEGGLCVKDLTAAADQPGDCLPSFEDPDLAPEDDQSADALPASQGVECALIHGSSGGSVSREMVSLAAIALLAVRRRRRPAR